MALQTASWSDRMFNEPMVPAEFAYSPLGALAAIAAGFVIASVLYALVLLH